MTPNPKPTPQSNYFHLHQVIGFGFTKYGAFLGPKKHMFLKNDSDSTKKNGILITKSQLSTCIRLWRSTHLPKFQGPAQTSYPWIGGFQMEDGKKT